MRATISTKLQQVLITTTLLILAPVIITTLILLYLYRCLVDITLKLQLHDKYAGLLNGPDSIWAIEEPSSLAIINVLIILEKDMRHSNINFLENFRRLVKDRIVDSSFDKLRYKRKKKFGYSYWEKNEEISLEDRVRWLEYERTSCDGSCDNIYNGHLKRILWNVCNQPLPEDSSASWEILVGRCCPRSSYHYLRKMEERVNSARIRIPVLFRVHHTLGDGTALLKFFKDAVIDQEPVQEILLKLDTIDYRERSEADYESFTVTSANDFERDLNGEKSLRYFVKDDVLSASMPFIHFVAFSQALDLLKRYLVGGLKCLQNVTRQEVWRCVIIFVGEKWDELKELVLRDVWDRGRRFFKIALSVVAAPICLVEQGLRSMDKSVLHGPELSGEKLVSYWMEDDFKNSYDQSLVTKIRTIKHMTAATFGDVLLAALSSSLHKYFLRVKEIAPETLNVILPMQIEEPDDKESLQNNITVGVLPLCISQANGQRSSKSNDDSQFLERLEDVKRANDNLLKSSDYAANFMVIKYLSAVLPEKLLRPILKSHSTMIVSNLIGPPEVRILGHTLKNIAFWIPNRSYTGIGFSLLTYRGYLHFSLMADKALVQDEKLLTEILENTVQEIENFYDRITSSPFSRKLHENLSTPMKTGLGVL